MRLKYNFLSKDGHEEVRLIECTEICQTDDGHIGIYAAEMDDVISQNKISDSDYKHILNELSDKGYYDLTRYGTFRQDEEDIDDRILWKRKEHQQIPYSLPDEEKRQDPGQDHLCPPPEG